MVDFENLGLRRDEIAAFASSPRAVASYEAIQSASLQTLPGNVTAAQTTADQAVTDAALADAAAAAAQAQADAANALAATKIDQATADARYVRQDQSPAWADPTGTLARSTFATYAAPVISALPTQAEVQALANHVQTLSRIVAALVTDLRAAQALT